MSYGCHVVSTSRFASRRTHLVHAEPAALDHCRATHADARRQPLGRVLDAAERGDDNVARAQERSVARKDVASGDADWRYESAGEGKRPFELLTRWQATGTDHCHQREGRPLETCMHASARAVKAELTGTHRLP